MPTIFNFKSKLWIYSGKGAWYFVTLPRSVADEINFLFSDLKRGWGSLRVDVKIGETNFKTSIFPDKKSHSFMLPIKAEVRKKENLKVDDNLKISLSVITN